MRRAKDIIFFIGLMLAYSGAVAQNKIDNIAWTTAAKLPAGPAGVFTGVSNDVLLVAGGSNFADGAMPWQGGKKLHYDEVFALRQSGGKFVWLKPATRYLQQKIAYGASVTVGNKVVCVGGETETAKSCNRAFTMYWSDEKHDVVFTDLPSLPIPIANACMTNIGNKVHLIGGETEGVPSNKVFVLDMNAAAPHWQTLPDLPVAMSHSVAVTQNNGRYLCIYVIGGRSSTPSGISELHHNAFCFDPVNQKWLELSPVSDGKVTNLSAATGVAIGKNDILIIGGDRGDIFHRIETYNAEIANATDLKQKERLQAEKIELLTHHPGFSRDVLLYNTFTNKWKKIGVLPFFGHVTTTAVIWDKGIYIPGGEIKPGVRTADVIKGELYRSY